MSSLIMTLPELIKMIDIYHNNPYILCRYRGTDWKKYISSMTHGISSMSGLSYNCKTLKLSNKLDLIYCMSGQQYKIETNDFIKVLDGCIYLNGARKLYEEEFLLYDSSCSRRVNPASFSEGKESVYGLCKGKSVYSTFLHYRSLGS